MPQIIIVEAEYKGNDTDKFKLGEIYTFRLNVYSNGSLMITTLNPPVIVSPHESIITLLQNWKNLTEVVK